MGNGLLACRLKWKSLKALVVVTSCLHSNHQMHANPIMRWISCLRAAAPQSPLKKIVTMQSSILSLRNHFQLKQPPPRLLHPHQVKNPNHSARQNAPTESVVVSRRMESGQCT